MLGNLQCTYLNLRLEECDRRLAESFGLRESHSSRYRLLAMSPGAISTVVFACVFGGSLLGMFVRRLVPGKYLSGESKETVRLAMGLVATTLALVLGLLIASAKGFYDNQNAELTQLASNVALLDRILAHYGPETADLRGLLRDSVTREMAFLFAPSSSGQTRDQPPRPQGEVLLDKIQELSPKDDNQRSLRAQALTLSIQTGQTRWLIFEQRTVPIPKLLLGTLLFWLIILFISFEIYAPSDLTSLAALCFAAGAVSSAIFLIIQMYHPYTGLIQLSDAPLRAALAQLGQ